MAAHSATETSPLSSEFEDLGLDDETSKSTGAGGESDWVEGGEEVCGARGRASASGSSAASQSGTGPHAPDAQRTDPDAGASPEIEPLDDAPASSGRGTLRAPREPDDKAYSTLKEIEDAGHKVADFTKHAATDLTKKLFGGGGEEPFSMTRLADGVSSWWSALDPGQLVADVSSGGSAAKAAQAKSDAQQLFELPATEEVLEQFACSLVQTYTCGHNAFTGPREVAWRGILYITDRHSCYKADADSTTLMLPHSDVTSVEKTEKGGKCSLRVAFGEEGEHLALRGFGSGGAAGGLDGALALLEHVTSGG